MDLDKLKELTKEYFQAISEISAWKRAFENAKGELIQLCVDEKQYGLLKLNETKLRRIYRKGGQND